MKHRAQQYPFPHKTLFHNENIVLDSSDRIVRDSGVDETWEKDEANKQRSAKHVNKRVRLSVLNYPLINYNWVLMDNTRN
jgi:hypothetical protein